MITARVLFVSSGRVATWTRPGLEPMRAAQAPGGAWCAWRLVGGNNREIARSARTYPDFQSCFEAVSQVQRSIGRSAPMIKIDPESRLWAWRLEIDGRVEVSGSRLYQRRRDCTFNIDQFRNLVVGATSDYSAAADLTPAVIRLPDTLAGTVVSLAEALTVG